MHLLQASFPLDAIFKGVQLTFLVVKAQGKSDFPGEMANTQSLKTSQGTDITSSHYTVSLHFTAATL